VRLVYICADEGIPLLGSKGASAHLRNVCAALAARGHAVTIACRRLGEGNLPPPEVTVDVMPAAEGDQTRWLADVLRRTGAAAVLERYSLSSGPGRTASRELGLPLVLEVNAPLVDEAARFRGLTDVLTWRRREREQLANADFVIAVSQPLAVHAVACGVPRERVSVVPNGVDLAGFTNGDGSAVRRRYGLEGTFVAGFCGSLKPWHGVADLIEATALLPAEVALLVVGDGRRRAELEDHVRARGLAGRVVLTGSVPHRDVPAHLAAMDVGVAPYAAQENFYFSPLKVVEYCAAGLPVVVTDQGEMSALAQAALLVPPGDVAALAEAIATLAADPPRRAAMAAAARRLAAGRDWSAVAERVERVVVSLREAA